MFTSSSEISTNKFMYHVYLYYKLSCYGKAKAGGICVLFPCNKSSRILNSPTALYKSINKKHLNEIISLCYFSITIVLKCPVSTLQALTNFHRGDICCVLWQKQPYSSCLIDGDFQQQPYSSCLIDGDFQQQPYSSCLIDGDFQQQP